MFMKKNLIIGICSLIAIVASASSYAQTEEAATIPLTVIAVKQQSVPETAMTYLNDKLMQVATKNGLGTTDYNSRFVITASIIPVTKDIIPGPPRQFSENLDITFYIVDNIDQKIYSSATVSAKAVEASEEKVLIKAIRSINVGSPKIAEFVNNGREKIITYYESQCDNIIAKAKSLASQNMFEAALFELNSIPSCCTEAYKKSSKVAEGVFDTYVDYWGNVCLSKARNLWMSEPNAQGAKKAGEYLCQILPYSKSYPNAEKLYQEIKNEVKADLDFEIKVYDDIIDLEATKVNAWKEIGVAFGKGQQPIDTNVTWLVK